nr:lysylphosphatidylglycerol synthase domain-containing protein [Xaviernesmea rhizosphaerae]
MASFLRRHAAALISLSAVLAYCAFIEWMWGWGRILAAWGAIGAGPVALALGLMIVTHLVRCLRVFDYFRQDLSGAFLRLFRVTQVHNLANILLPFRAGEASFFVLMRSEFSMPMARSAASLLWMRVLDLHALLAVGLIGLVAAAPFPLLAWAAWVAYCLLPIAGFAFQRPLFSVVSRRFPGKVARLAESVLSGLPQSWAPFFRAWAMTVVNWSVKVATIAWILTLLGAPGLAAALGGALGGELSSVLPAHAPGGVGTYPAGIVAGALAFGAPAGEPALSALSQAAVNAHLMVLVSAAAGTLLSLLLAPRAAPARPTAS